MASIIKVDQIQESTTGVGTNFSGTGSASTPTISIGNQTNKGFYHEGTNKIGVSVGGVKVGEIGAGYGGFTGNIIQVVSATKTDTFTDSSNPATWVNIPGLSVSITPKYTSSKILILFNLTMAAKEGYFSAGMRLVRNSTAIYLGDTAGSRLRASGWMWSDIQQYIMFPLNGNFLDSPNTTSATTYLIQGISGYAGETYYINRNKFDSNTANNARTASTITVMEIQQ